jgi:hypothetical protein
VPAKPIIKAAAVELSNLILIILDTPVNVYVRFGGPLRTHVPGNGWAPPLVPLVPLVPSFSFFSFSLCEHCESQRQRRGHRHAGFFESGESGANIAGMARCCPSGVAPTRSPGVDHRVSIARRSLTWR